MLIIAGRFRVDPEQRDAFVATHADLVRRARAAPGCLDLAISADPIDADRVNNFERWASDADLAAWRAVARAPRHVSPILEGDMQKYEISATRPPFA